MPDRTIDLDFNKIFIIFMVKSRSKRIYEVLMSVLVIKKQLSVLMNSLQQTARATCCFGKKEKHTLKEIP
jgi:hypothetical protein